MIIREQFGAAFEKAHLAPKTYDFISKAMDLLPEQKCLLPEPLQKLLLTDPSLRLTDPETTPCAWLEIDRLAVHAELSKTHVNELEAGKRDVGLRALERLARALDVKISELLEAIGR